MLKSTPKSEQVSRLAQSIVAALDNIQVDELSYERIIKKVVKEIKGYKPDYLNKVNRRMTALQQFLVVSRILPYRYVEIILDAFHSAGADFSIQGLDKDSPSFLEILPSMAKHHNLTFAQVQHLIGYFDSAANKEVDDSIIHEYCANILSNKTLTSRELLDFLKTLQILLGRLSVERVNFPEWISMFHNLLERAELDGMKDRETMLDTTFNLICTKYTPSLRDKKLLLSRNLRLILNLSDIAGLESSGDMAEQLNSICEHLETNWKAKWLWSKASLLLEHIEHTDASDDNIEELTKGVEITQKEDKNASHVLIILSCIHQFLTSHKEQSQLQRSFIYHVLTVLREISEAVLKQYHEECLSDFPVYQLALAQEIDSKIYHKIESILESHREKFQQNPYLAPLGNKAVEELKPFCDKLESNTNYEVKLAKFYLDHAASSDDKEYQSLFRKVYDDLWKVYSRKNEHERIVLWDEALTLAAYLLKTKSPLWSDYYQDLTGIIASFRSVKLTEANKKLRKQAAPEEYVAEDLTQLIINETNEDCFDKFRKFADQHKVFIDSEAIFCGFLKGLSGRQTSDIPQFFSYYLEAIGLERLKKLVNIKIKDSDFDPLNQNIQNGHWNICAELIQYGADACVTVHGSSAIDRIVAQLAENVSLLDDFDFIACVCRLISQYGESDSTISDRISLLVELLQKETRIEPVHLEKLFKQIFAVAPQRDIPKEVFELQVAEICIRVGNPQLLYQYTKSPSTPTSGGNICTNDTWDTCKTLINLHWRLPPEYDKTLLPALLDYKNFYQYSVISFLGKTEVKKALSGLNPSTLRNAIIQLLVSLTDNIFNEDALPAQAMQLAEKISQLNVIFSQNKKDVIIFMTKALAKMQCFRLEEVLRMYNSISSCSLDNLKVIDVIDERVHEILEKAEGNVAQKFQHLSDHVFHNLFRMIPKEEVKRLFIDEEEDNLLTCFNNKIEAVSALFAEYEELLSYSSTLSETLFTGPPAHEVETAEEKEARELIEARNMAATIKGNRSNSAIVLAGLALLINQRLRKQLHHTQMIAILAFVHLDRSDINQLILAQISTGQGKSIILAILAAYLAICKDLFVDILTSTEYLASRDIEDLKKFYEILDIKTASNDRVPIVDEETGEKTLQSVLYTTCYPLLNTSAFYHAKPLNYVDKISFQEREKHAANTYIPPERKAVLIDEIDTLITKPQQHYGHSFCSLQNLKWLYIIIYQHTAIGLRGMLEILEKTEEWKNLKSENPSLAHFIESECLRSWIGVAQYVKEERPMRLELDKDNQVIYTDKDTGARLPSGSQTSGGYEQFRRIKYEGTGVPWVDEALTTFYVDIESFLKEYKVRYGVTGTPGLLPSREMIKESYNARMFTVPHFRRLLGHTLNRDIYSATHDKNEKFPKILPVTLSPNTENWAETMALVAAKISRKDKRPVLIIVDSELELAELKKPFRENIHENCLQILDSSSEANKVSEVVKNAGETNDEQEHDGYVTLVSTIGSRGIDVKLNNPLILKRASDQDAGLHVILGSLVDYNKYRQVFGRGARQAQPGVFQIIIDISKANKLMKQEEINESMYFNMHDRHEDFVTKLKHFHETFANKLVAGIKSNRSERKAVHDLNKHYFLAGSRKEELVSEQNVSRWSMRLSKALNTDGDRALLADCVAEYNNEMQEMMPGTSAFVLRR